MKRTTVKIPDGLDAQLRSEAKRTGSTIAAITRAALEAYLSPGDGRRLIAAGAGRSGRSDISTRIDQILSEELEKPA